tara:strand:- start:818 stop:1003 length:186 start_codon:yes stop_codon:yes gene_type:complete
MKTDNIDNVILGDIYPKDYPDFVDAYIESCDIDGTPATKQQLDELNEDYDFLQECIDKYLY